MNEEPTKTDPEAGPAGSTHEDTQAQPQASTPEPSTGSSKLPFPPILFVDWKQKETFREEPRGPPPDPPHQARSRSVEPPPASTEREKNSPATSKLRTLLTRKPAQAAKDKLKWMEDANTRWEAVYNDLEARGDGVLHPIREVVAMGHNTNSEFKLKEAWCLGLGRVGGHGEEGAEGGGEGTQDQRGKTWFLQYHVFLGLVEGIQIAVGHKGKLKAHFQDPDFTDVEIKWLKSRGHLATKDGGEARKATAKTHKFVVYGAHVPWHVYFQVMEKVRPVIMVGNRLDASMIRDLSPDDEREVGLQSATKKEEWLAAIDDLERTHNVFSMPEYENIIDGVMYWRKPEYNPPSKEGVMKKGFRTIQQSWVKVGGKLGRKKEPAAQGQGQERQTEGGVVEGSV
ncbi:hypothetical protein MKZ38_007500 [Zalerion maritima]|uniref:SRR1-like domain-containing protein n=1 Tax=Zalerion maritima TaxID=339359 RepID=A0AAD5RHM9_9PEZI|nr:hypothetical protein MKZ38_007500 [Zalerion maritima]